MKKKFIIILLVISSFSIIMVGCGIGSNSDNESSDNINENVVSFDTVTLGGTEIDSSILNDSTLTMINVWATYCPPCIAEIPDIQNLFVELNEEEINVNIIGIVSDTPSADNEKTAKQILESSSVEYTNIIPDQKLLDGIFQEISVVPTTIFVDSEGNIVGEFVLGAHSKDEYKEEIVNRLDSLK